MRVIFTEDFDEYLAKIKDPSILKRVVQAIEKLERAPSLREVTNIKAIRDSPNFYRLRFGDFRIGFHLEREDIIRLLVIDHRSKIYRIFPRNFA